MINNRMKIRYNIFNKNIKSSTIKFKLDLIKFNINNIPNNIIELIIYNLIQLHEINNI